MVFVGVVAVDVLSARPTPLMRGRAVEGPHIDTRRLLTVAYHETPRGPSAPRPTERRSGGRSGRRRHFKLKVLLIAELLFPIAEQIISAILVFAAEL